MERAKYRYRNRLGTSGIVVSIILLINTVFFSLLLMTCSFLNFASINQDVANSVFKFIGVHNPITEDLYTTNGFLLFISNQGILTGVSIIFVLILVLWLIYYKINSIYSYRAIRCYGITTIFTSAVVIILSLLVSPTMSKFFPMEFLKFGEAIRMFKWFVLLSAIPVLIYGVFLLIVSLIAMLPAKSNMIKPSGDGKSDVSFVIDEQEDEDINQFLYDEEHREKVEVPEGNPDDLDVYQDAKSKYELDNIEYVNAEIIQNDIVCNQCGHKNKVNTNYCANCGNKV